MSKRGHAESGLDTTADERPYKRVLFPFRAREITPEAATPVDTPPTCSKKRSRAESEGPDADERPAKRVASTPPLVSIASLPHEILEAILDISLPSAAMFKTQPAPRFQQINDVWRASMAFRRDIVLVCKLWCELGRRILYREIVIHDRFMLRALRRTLDAQPGLGELVRSIYLRTNRKGCEANNYDDAMTEVLVRVLELCPDLTRFVHAPPVNHPGIPRPLPTLAPNLTVLNIGVYRVGYGEYALDQQWVPDALKRSCGTLEELWITAADLAPLDKMSLSFPRLHTLYLHCHGYSKRFASKWEVPKLTKLTFLPLARTAFEEHNSLTPVFKEYTRILKQHGAELTSLVFPPRYPRHNGKKEKTHATLLSLCPALEHVVLPALKAPDVALTVPLPGVRALDIWCRDHWGGTPSKRVLARLITRIFPNLERRPRLLDPTLTRVFVDVPSVLEVLEDSSRALPPAEVIAALAADDAPESDDEDVGQEEQEPIHRNLRQSRRALPAAGDVTPRGLRYAGCALRTREFGDGLGVYYRPVLPTAEDLEEESLSNHVEKEESAAEQEGHGREWGYGVEERLDFKLAEEEMMKLRAWLRTRRGLHFRPRLRRVLQAVLPSTLFARLEQAVEELLEDAQS
ncbi:hypothetical protein FB45DRAFT_1064445 [Roridomyces roridus]|uniref:F-box domain-containing protein n=1 Tax=Roridomyces roridus TaxID=1738132 RepID=A0AAD7BB47_9AGAR|nr:hypothetical protein FB45DRAFT_1064445 [Roridomyces roridus]